jgi:cellulose biosynthesis protein BcsQ
MVLAPLVPEMSSVAGLRAIEQAFSGIVDREGRTLAPFYVLNRFDPGLPLHLDIREILRRELDGRLLPVVVRRSPVVSEALAEGTTSLNYAPNSPVADDYRALARWLVDAAPASAEAIPDAERGAR